MKFAQPNITEAEVAAVAQVVRSGGLASGEVTKAFEAAFAERWSFEHVVAVNSGTTALWLALVALGVGPGDEVITTPYSFVATVNCILAVGATPVFCDIDRWTYNLDPKKLDPLLTAKTKVILPASIFGVPCDIDGIRLRAAGVPILEDSMEALGAKRDGRYVGVDADISTFGFFPNKQITTGQGGVIVTSNPAYADKVRRLRQHGWPEQHDMWDQDFGHNVRLPDVLAALGLVQLERFEEMQATLDRVAVMYDSGFYPFRRQCVRVGDHASHFNYVVELPVGVDKRLFCDRMERQGVPVRPYFHPLHHAAYVEPWFRPCPVADEVGAHTVALPFHCAITGDDVDAVAAAFANAMARGGSHG
jgi:perosamine synthetase